MEVITSNRISGSLFGLLIGDALGTAVESQPPGSFEPVMTLNGGGKFQLKPGQFTDDGSMALCLAIALLDKHNNGLHNSIIQMNIYRRWYEFGYLSSTGECFDIGITVRTALNKYVAECNKHENGTFPGVDAYFGSTGNMASGNGSLMRLAPVPLLFHKNPLIAIDEAVNSSKTTHASVLCLDSCRVYTTLIVGALQGANKEELLNSEKLFIPIGLPNDYWTTSPLETSIMSVMAGSYKQRNPPQIKASGFVIDTLEAALWAFYHTDSFQEGALKAVNLGDDADTVGAVYGMLAGAYYGMAAIPTEWISRCSFSSLVQTIADEIIEASGIFESTVANSITLRDRSSLIYTTIMRVYDALAMFYSKTIKRRVLPCPRQYKSIEDMNEDVTAFENIYKTILQSPDLIEEMKITLNQDEQQLIYDRSKSILQQFLNLINNDKHTLTLKWSRSSATNFRNLAIPLAKIS